MADASKRLTDDTPIDYGSITIDVNGRVTGSSSGYQDKRSDNANPNDGFVYTSSTRQDGDGGFYYRYTGIDMAANISTLPIYDGNKEDAAFLSLDHFRNSNNNEGIINFMIGKTGKEDRINGHPTKTDKFLYNEGNEYLSQADTKNHSIDGKDSLGKLNNKIGNGYTSADGISFYDRYADKWTPELTMVRGMTNGESGEGA